MQPTTIYSSFFSSGLHNANSAPVVDPARTLELDVDLELSESETEFNTLSGGSSYSPSRPSSPIPVPIQSEFVTSCHNDMDVDPFSAYPPTTSSRDDRALERGSVTPTPGSRQTTPVPIRIQTNLTSQRLRTRRSKSSLTQSLTSPKAIHDVKSPTRAASNALSLQIQMQQMHNRNNGGDGDLQSGTPSLTRRLFPFFRRRRASMPIPAAVPPPTLPLPALPLQAQAPLLSPCPLEDSTQHNLISSDSTSGDMPPARRRGLSKSSLASEEHRINEIAEIEMKEN